MKYVYMKTIEIVPTKHDVEMKASTRTIIAITVIDKWIWVNRDESGVGGYRWGIVDTVACLEHIYIFHNIKRYYARWMICL